MTAIAYKDKDVESYESLVRMCAAEAMGNNPPVAAIPVEVTITAYFQIAETRKKGKNRLEENQPHLQKPDEDNIKKGIKDGMESVVYVNDCIVWKATCIKRWSATPRAEVEVTY